MNLESADDLILTGEEKKRKGKLKLIRWVQNIGFKYLCLKMSWYSIFSMSDNAYHRIFGSLEY